MLQCASIGDQSSERDVCGIVGGYGSIEPEHVRRMMGRIAHRGPDDDGLVEVAGNALGHRRLSIVDVEGGKQPLATPDKGLYLVGNGEVYNHEEVLETLEDRGMTTRSDNEVALRLVAERGPGALSELLGMYAFLMANGDGGFIAARDPVGIKPLYWARPEAEGPVFFASEMRAFDEDLQPSVEAFPPGHYWAPHDGLVRFGRAAPADDLEPIDGPAEPGAPIPDAILEEVRERLIRTVKRQMMGDVPVGVFLSGGLDSSLVAAVAARWYERRGEKLKTFAVGLEDSPDLLAARAVAEHLGTEHHESVYTQEDALKVLPEVVRTIENFDPSLVRSAVPNYILAEFAAKHVKVVLTGEGADEIFAGYEYLEDFRTEEDLHVELVLAFEGWLPDDFLWRKKAQFGDGSGAASVLKDRMEESVTEEEFERERHEVEPPLRTREEVAYYRIFAEVLGGIRPGRTISRFATAA